MLSIAPIDAGSAGDFAEYHEDEQARTREDYYYDSENCGQWNGQLAESLGLTGEIQKGQLLQMLQGYNPATREALAGNAGDKHKPGWDMAFSADKSVSIIWAVANPELRAKIEEAQQRAVQAGMNVLQQNAFNSRDRSERHEKITEIIYGTYQHGASRRNDMDMHTHAVVANMGKRSDSTICAIDFDSRWKMAAGATYRAQLAHEMQQLGFTVEPGSKGTFQVSGIPNDLRDHFSKGRFEIEQRLIEKGFDSAKAAAIANLDTRKAKDAGLKTSELLEIWQQECKAMGFTPEKIAALQSAHKTELKPMPSHEELLLKLTEYASTFTPMQLQAAIAVEAQGKLDSAGIQSYTNGLMKDENLVRLMSENQRMDKRAGLTEMRFTSREMLDLEKGIADKAIERVAETTHHADIGAAVAARSTMSAEQKTALAHICQQSGGVAMIEGMAGTGKSYLMGAAREAWEAADFNLRGCALAGKAAEGLENGSGIKSQTLASMLMDINRGKMKLSSKDVIVLDEAGMVGSRQMSQLLDHVHAAGAKAVLIGDSKQLQPIDAGGSFRVLSQKLGHASLTDIRRQHNEKDREIVKQLAAGEAGLALASMKERGILSAHDDKQTAMREMVRDWFQARDPAKPGEALMLAGTRAEVYQMNQLAREELKQRHQLAVSAGVTTTKGNREFAEGDRMLFTKNNKKLGVKNGTLGTLQRIEMDPDGAYRFIVKTDNGQTVKFTVGDAEATKGKAFNDFDHGYAVSVHKAQGVTVDRPFVLLGEQMSDREWGYVAASRGREETKFYTTSDVVGDLDKLLSRSRQKDTALDYIPETKMPTTNKPHKAPENTPKPTQPKHEEYEHE